MHRWLSVILLKSRQKEVNVRPWYRTLTMPDLSGYSRYRETWLWWTALVLVWRQRHQEIGVSIYIYSIWFIQLSIWYVADGVRDESYKLIHFYGEKRIGIMALIAMSFTICKMIRIGWIIYTMIRNMLISKLACKHVWISSIRPERIDEY